MRSLVLALAAVLLATTVPASAQQAMRPCGERQIGSERRDGAVIHIFRIRPQAGTVCRMNMNVGGNAMIRQVRVLDRPRHGRLVQARRNAIVYRAPSARRNDAFSLAMRVQNLRGTGWIHFVIQVQTR